MDVDATRDRRQPAVRRPRGSRARAADAAEAPSSRCGRSRRISPAEHALQGFDGVRAYAADPARSEALLGETLGFDAGRARALGGARASGAAASTPTTPPSRTPARCRAPAPSTTSRSPRRPRTTRHGVSGLIAGGRPRHAGDRPLLLPLDLLPRAERGAVRDRHDRPRLRRRRGRGAPRRAAVAAAAIRAAARQLDDTLTPLPDPRLLHGQPGA